jgi:hypothetical protein
MVWRAYTDSSLGAGAHVSGVQRHNWADYGNYIGILGAIAIGVSLFGAACRANDARDVRSRLAIAVLATSCLSSPRANSTLRAGVGPGFSDVTRWLEPYTIAVVLFGALAIAGRRHAIERWLTTPRRRHALTAVCAIGVASLIFVNQRPFTNAVSQPPQTAASKSSTRPRTRARAAAVVRGADLARPLVWSETTPRSRRSSSHQTAFSLPSWRLQAVEDLSQPNYAPGCGAMPDRSSSTASGGKMYVHSRPDRPARSPSRSRRRADVRRHAVCRRPGGLALAWNLALAPVIANRVAASEVAVATRSFAIARSSDESLILISLAAAIAVRRTSPTQSDRFAVIAAASFASHGLSARSGRTRPPRAGATFVAPAVFSRFWVHDANAYPLFLTTGLLGAMWRRGSPAALESAEGWRVPLVGWGSRRRSAGRSSPCARSTSILSFQAC